ncbi:MAG TPA: SurA N-terminal domain-containing protein [Candidatus Paceibacterota bacterium]
MSDENRTEDKSVTPEGDRSAEMPETHAVPVPVSTEAPVAPTAEVPAAAPEATPEEKIEETPASAAETKAAGAAAISSLTAKWLPKKWYITAIAVVIVAAVLVAVAYMMEQQGRLNTGLFDGVNRMVSMQKAVATVNDAKISQYDLDISMSQISAGAAMQGIDIADPEIKAKIQEQAIEMLVNTELLKQEAAARNISITDADVDARLETLRSDVGGEEVLVERMAEFNIDQKTLLRDIRSELTIQKLLDEVFAEKGVEITEADIEDFYDANGGEAAGLPPLTDVREEIETQIRSDKQQEIVTAFVEELRGKSSVEILI